VRRPLESTVTWAQTCQTNGFLEALGASRSLTQSGPWSSWSPENSTSAWSTPLPGNPLEIQLSHIFHHLILKKGVLSAMLHQRRSCWEISGHKADLVSETPTLSGLDDPTKFVASEQTLAGAASGLLFSGRQQAGNGDTELSVERFNLAL